MMLRTKNPRRGQYDWLLHDLDPVPPKPPERGRPRVHIQIEIIERRPMPAPRPMFGALVFLLIVLAMMGLTHAHSEEWRTYESSGTTFSESSDGWRSQSYTLGGRNGTTFTEFVAPWGGTTRHCATYRLGHETYTNCY